MTAQTGTTVAAARTWNQVPRGRVAAVQLSSGGSAPQPIVANVSPAMGTLIAPSTPIQFDIIDTSGMGFALILPTIVMDPFALPELVYNNTTFTPDYILRSTKVAITNGWRFTIQRHDGWRSQPQLIIYAVNKGGTAWVGP